MYVLGRMATRIAEVLHGQAQAHLTPHVNVGDGVVVINATKLKVTGNKRDQGLRHYSGYRVAQAEDDAGARHARCRRPDQGRGPAHAAQEPHRASDAEPLKVYAAATIPTRPQAVPAARSTDNDGSQESLRLGTGRRKTSVARVRIKSGSGAFTINGKEVKSFSRPPTYGTAVKPLAGRRGRLT
jgi:large subunit ribosomal protein L13